jgi:flagellar protein FlaG
VGNLVQTGQVRPETTPAREPVTTQLAPSQSVTAVAETQTARQNPVAAALARATTERDLIIDAQSREVIYRVISAQTGRVVRQVPDEAILRLRAYSRALASGANPSAAEAEVDVEA